MRFTLEPPSVPEEKPVALRLVITSNDNEAILEAQTKGGWSSLLWLDNRGRVHRRYLVDHDRELGFQASADGYIAIANPDKNGQ